MERLVMVFNAFYAIERKVVQFIMPVGGCTLGLEESKRIEWDAGWHTIYK